MGDRSRDEKMLLPSLGLVAIVRSNSHWLKGTRFVKLSSNWTRPCIGQWYYQPHSFRVVKNGDKNIKVWHFLDVTMTRLNQSKSLTFFNYRFKLYGNKYQGQTDKSVYFTNQNSFNRLQLS